MKVFLLNLMYFTFISAHLCTCNKFIINHQLVSFNLNTYIRVLQYRHRFRYDCNRKYRYGMSLKNVGIAHPSESSLLLHTTLSVQEMHQHEWDLFKCAGQNH